jgi:4-oxalmesaconate hydratase
LLFDVINLDNILFGSEMVGAVRGIDPETGNYFDDTKRFVDALHLTPLQREQVYSLNARRVYPRLDASLTARGL